MLLQRRKTFEGATVLWKIWILICYFVLFEMVPLESKIILGFWMVIFYKENIGDICPVNIYLSTYLMCIYYVGLRILPNLVREGSSLIFWLYQGGVEVNPFV